jgi:hypothetical protein
MKKLFLIIGHILLFGIISLWVYNYYNHSIIRPWPGGVIPYAFVGEFTSKQKELIQMAMTRWQQASDNTIKFIPSEKNRGPIYYIIKKTSGELAVSSSTVGYYFIGNYVYLSDIGAKDLLIILHELGHCLGLVHEHQRPDRDKYVKVFFANIEKRYAHNYYIRSGGNFIYQYQKWLYDYNSIMHYPNKVFAIDPSKDTIIAKGNHIIKCDYISWADALKIRYIYRRK